MECPICKQQFMILPSSCAACGFPIEQAPSAKLNPKTKQKAIEFLPTIRTGGWFEVKAMGYKKYLYGRFRSGGMKKSKYLGRI
jgi:hypothetical protein